MAKKDKLPHCELTEAVLIMLPEDCRGLDHVPETMPADYYEVYERPRFEWAETQPPGGRMVLLTDKGKQAFRDAQGRKEAKLAAEAAAAEGAA